MNHERQPLVKTIYIPLLDEGTVVARPAPALVLGDNIFKVLPTENYDPSDEHWQFPPGSIVRCVVENRGGKNLEVAREIAEIS